MGFEYIFEKCSDKVKLKDGGQKSVYKCNHSQYGEIVLKIGKFNNELTQIERITREYNILKELNSVYYPKNYEFFVDMNNNEFLIIEEYIDSLSFGDVQKHYLGNESEIINLLEKLVTALKIIWDKNIIHRDLKPDNILFKKDFSVVIIDLGIAKFADKNTITKTQPYSDFYAAAEQILNQRDLIDSRTDLFSIGVILYELCFGKRPFQTSYEIMEGIYEKPEYIGNMSKKFNIIINKLLQKQQFKRFKNYTKVIESIEDYKNGEQL